MKKKEKIFKMEKEKTNYIFLLLLFVSLFGLIIQINNYNTLLHNADLSFNVFIMVNDFNYELNKITDKSFYMNNSNIEDYTDYGRNRNLFELYVESIGRLRRIILPIIFLSMTFMFALIILIENGRKRNKKIN